MANGSPGDRPEWVLKGGLAQFLASSLGRRQQTDHPQLLSGFMQITHKMHPSIQV